MHLRCYKLSFKKRYCYESDPPSTFAVRAFFAALLRNHSATFAFLQNLMDCEIEDSPECSESSENDNEEKCNQLLAITDFQAGSDTIKHFFVIIRPYEARLIVYFKTVEDAELCTNAKAYEMATEDVLKIDSPYFFYKMNQDSKGFVRYPEMENTSNLPPSLQKRKRKRQAAVTITPLSPEHDEGLSRALHGEDDSQ